MYIFGVTTLAVWNERLISQICLKNVSFCCQAEDNVGVLEVKRTNPENNFPVGKTTKVVFRATDKAGNNAECSFTVTVKKQGKKPAHSCDVVRKYSSLYLSFSAYSCQLYNCS